jgi:hypothetical protein
MEDDISQEKITTCNRSNFSIANILGILPTDQFVRQESLPRSTSDVSRVVQGSRPVSTPPYSPSLISTKSQPLSLIPAADFPYPAAASVKGNEQWHLLGRHTSGENNNNSCHWNAVDDDAGAVEDDDDDNEVDNDEMFEEEFPENPRHEEEDRLAPDWRSENDPCSGRTGDNDHRSRIGLVGRSMHLSRPPPPLLYRQATGSSPALSRHQVILILFAVSVLKTFYRKLI